MSTGPDPRLKGLRRISEVLAESSLAELAEASRACAVIEARLARLEAECRTARDAARTPQDGLVVARMAVLSVARRRVLLQELASARARRLEILARARRHEGRRQALGSLNGDQAS